MTTLKPVWQHGAIFLAWLGALAGGLAYLNRPGAAAAVPAGWQVWPQPGPTLALALTPHGAYCGGRRGLFRLGPGDSATPVAIPGRSTNAPVEALLLDRNGALWVGHEQGLSIRTASGWTTLTERDGLPHRRVRALAGTHDGFVWAGTARGAVRLPMDGPWSRADLRRVTTRDGLPHDTVRAILEDDEGGVWFGSQAPSAGGLSRLMDGRWTHWTPAEGLPHTNVTSLLQVADGRLWVGCGYHLEGGAAVFARRAGLWRLERSVPTEELAGAKVRSLCTDGRGRIWLGSEYDGVTVRGTRGTLRILTVRDGLPAMEVMAIARGRDGSMWLGTPAGVVRLRPQALAALFPDQSLAKGDAAP